MRFRKELERWQEMGEEAGDSYAECRRIERRLGLRQVTTADLPQDWTDTAREHFVDRAGLFAEWDEEEFERALTMQLSTGNLAHTALRNRARRARQEQLRRRREVQAENVGGQELYCADVAVVDELRLGTPGAIVTDPPYGKEHLACWSDLAAFAQRVLPEHGWVVAMSGQAHLPEVFQRMTDGGLVYRWTMAVHTPGAESTQGWIGRQNALNTYWKPVLVFSVGEASEWPDLLSDHLESPAADRIHHRWGQNALPFERLVSFASPGQLVVDPFLGGGTTAIAAYRQKRAFEGFDIEAQSVATAQTRMRDEVEQLELVTA